VNRIGNPVNVVLLTLGLLASGAHASLPENNKVHLFIDEMVENHDFGRSELEKTFAEVERLPGVLEAISRPAESKPWYQYRPIFVTNDRVREGIQFLREHAAILEKAEREYGVPPHIIVAILGVETRYGKHRGGYRVIDALSTLAFEYPPRSSFFRRQLEHYLLMTREESMSPFSLKGSYAGAMGQPQFIPSSFRSYAVDFNEDGRRDLWDDPEDIIGSVANYFHRHGWQPGKPVIHRAMVAGDGYTELVDRGLKPQTAAGELDRFAVFAEESIPDGAQVSLIELEQRDTKEYWVARKNFYVITRYNHSPLYAMAVHQLSQAISAGME